MIELVRFSLKNRFYNKATIILNVILVIVFFLMFSVDFIMLAVDPSYFDKPELVISKEVIDRFSGVEEELQREYTLVNQKTEDVRFLSIEEGIWQIQYTEKVEGVELARLEEILELVIENQRNQEISLSIQTMMKPIFNHKVTAISMQGHEEISTENEISVFVVITAIYFMMLSYSAMIANEVVHEKTSRVLELILTSVSTRTHLLSKMIISWLTILIQAALVLGYCITFAGIRFLHDYGAGMIKFFVKIGLCNLQLRNFASLFHFYNINGKTVQDIIWALLFLFLGILFVQLVLVILSSYVKSVEESASIQGPFYFFLLFVYYLALSLNTPAQLSEGVGFIGSFVPFFSMLLMPARLMVCSVTAQEKMIGLALAVSALILTVVIGEKYYKRGILDSRLRKVKK